MLVIMVLVVFVVLKIVKVINWSWGWVLSPLWIAAAAALTQILLQLSTGTL